MDDGLFLALDQGGHACRALAFDARGNCISSAEQPFATHRAGSRVEQEGDGMAAAMFAAIAALADHLGPAMARVAAAGLATQRSSIIAVDRNTGRTLTPVLSWEDLRAAAWLRALAPDPQSVRRITGLRVSAHYGASKMRWCLDHDPHVQEAYRAGSLAIVPLASFLAHRLSGGGRLVVDPCNASRTLLWDLHTRDWSERLLHLFGIPRGILPDTVPNRFPFGVIAAGKARVPLTVVTGDQSAAPFAGGAPDGNTVYVNLGTGAFIQRPAARKEDAPTRLLHSVAWMDGERLVFMDEGTVNGAGSAIAAESRRAGLEEAEAFAELRAGLDSAHAPPLFLNGVSGLGSPWWVADFPSRMVGDGPPRARLAAVAESIVFLLYRNFVELCGADAPRTMVVTGGLARLDGLCARLASLTGCEVRRPANAEATARGLAWLTAGGPDGWPEGPCDVFPPGPHPEGLRDRYAAWLEAMERTIGAL